MRFTILVSAGDVANTWLRNKSLGTVPLPVMPTRCREPS